MTDEHGAFGEEKATVEEMLLHLIVCIDAGNDRSDPDFYMAAELSHENTVLTIEFGGQTFILTPALGGQ